MDAPLVSVLMTAYNRERFIAEAIESVLAQRLRDFELVVCDDASSDSTVAIAQHYASRDSRVVVLANDRNLGDYANRNRAAAAARGRYIKYHDSDDIMYPHCLTVMVEAFERQPEAQIALSASRPWPGGPCPMLLTPRLAYEREFLGGGLFHLGPGSAMIRTDTFRALGEFPMAGAASDYLFWLRACARVPVVLVAGDLFFYRVHTGQEITKPTSVEAYARASGAAWRMLNSDDCPLDSSVRQLAKRNYTFGAARGAFRLARRRRFGAAATIIRHAGLTPLDWVRYLRPPRRQADAGTPRPPQVNA